jgi:dephospho-CoA kinase
MLTIGLLGGVASGKSCVARMLAELGAGVLDADRAGHEVLADPEVTAALERRWSGSILDSAGRPDRAAIAARVFRTDPQAVADRAFLEDLLHPRIGRRLKEQAERLNQAGQDVVVLDAPLLLEAGWDTQCDLLIFVDAPRALRLERAQARGWSVDQFAQRESAQLDVSQKRARADIVVPNEGSTEQLRQHVQQVWQDRVLRRT